MLTSTELCIFVGRGRGLPRVVALALLGLGAAAPLRAQPHRSAKRGLGYGYH